MSNLNKRFNEEGYVCIQQFLSGDKIKEVVEMVEILKSEDQIAKIPSDMVFYEDKDDAATLKQIQHIYRYQQYFNNLMFNSEFQALAEELLGEKAIGKNMQYFNKPPLVNKPTPPHQDGYYFMLNPNHAVTMWLALEEVDEENGCVRYVKGSHKLGMRSHVRTNTLGFSQGIDNFGKMPEDSNQFYAPLKPGDLLAHHSMTIHYAGMNTSPVRSRQGLGFIYYAESAREDQQAHERYQKQLREELKKEKKL